MGNKGLLMHSSFTIGQTNVKQLAGDYVIIRFEDDCVASSFICKLLICYNNVFKYLIASPSMEPNENKLWQYQ
jgi:hypothetical protein